MFQYLRDKECFLLVSECLARGIIDKDSFLSSTDEALEAVSIFLSFYPDIIFSSGLGILFS